MLTVTHLKAEHFWLGWLPGFRITLLAMGGTASLWLALRLVRAVITDGMRAGAAMLAMLLPVGTMCGLWSLVFFVW